MDTTKQFELAYRVVENEDTPCTAIVVAAGKATRMGGNKQFLELLGIPVLARSLMAFQGCEAIRDMIVVAREDEIADVQKLVDEYSLSKVIAVVAGGKERQDSVANGLAAVPRDTVYIAIHDGARPMITPEGIASAVEAVKEKGAVALAVPVKDTIKIVGDGGRIIDTPDRSCLFAMQTPQVFDIDIYRKAFALAQEQNLSVTDDCAICEAAGHPVYIIHGDYRNIKITTPEDLWIARSFLEQEGK